MTTTPHRWRTTVTAMLAIAVTALPGTCAHAQTTPTDVQQIPVTANPAATPLLRRGIAAFENGDAVAAGSLFAAAARLDPTSTTAAFFVVLTAPTTTDPSARLRAVLAHATNLPSAERLALHYLADQHDFDVNAQLDDARQLVAVLPRSPTAHAMLAEAKRLTGDVPGAKNELQRAITLDPTYAPAYNALGHLALGDDDHQAIAMFTSYAKLLPVRAAPQDALGEAYLHAGRFADAVRSFSDAIRLEPNFTAAYQGLVVTNLYRGDRRAATAALDGLVAHVVDDTARSYADLDVAFYRTAIGDHAGADAALDDSLRRRPGDGYWAVTVEVLRGAIRVDTKRIADAIAGLTALAPRIAALPITASQRDGLDALRLSWLATAQGRAGNAKDAAASAAALARIAANSPGDRVRAEQASAAGWEAAMARHDPTAALRAIEGCDTCKLQRALARRANGDTTGAAAILRDLRRSYDRSTEAALNWTLLPKP